MTTTPMDRPFIKATTVVLLVLAPALAAPSASARDKEFGEIVHHIESYYHTHRSHRFLMGFAGLCVRVAHPEGVKSMKIALFENQDFSATTRDNQFDHVVRSALSQGWQPMVRVWSRRRPEHTYVYAKDAGKNEVKFLVVSLEADEAVVVQVKVNPDRLAEMMDDPAEVVDRGAPGTATAD